MIDIFGHQSQGDTLRINHSDKSKSFVLDYGVHVNGNDHGVLQIGETRAIPVEDIVVDVEIGTVQYFPGIQKVKLKLSLKWHPIITFETHADGMITYTVSGADILS